MLGKNTTVVILGGAGFLGSTITKNLSRNGSYTIFNPTRKECDLLNSENLTSLLSNFDNDFVLINCEHQLRLF